MLAQNFMSAAELQISDKERNALISVLGMLEREEIPHYPLAINLVPHTSKPTGFNMASIFGHAECGTSACMLGWAKFISGDPLLFLATVTDVHETRELFYGAGSTSAETTPAQAAHALRGYLTTGKVNWKEALNQETCNVSTEFQNRR